MDDESVPETVIRLFAGHPTKAEVLAYLDKVEKQLDDLEALVNRLEAERISNEKEADPLGRRPRTADQSPGVG